MITVYPHEERYRCVLDQTTSQQSQVTGMTYLISIHFLLRSSILQYPLDSGKQIDLAARRRIRFVKELKVSIWFFGMGYS